ncbi:hypothetical protein GCM10008018_55840 [Paenibacillus marchantiophytorum]|uniref:Uncharacterized protein n=1 Tax=Paenibacillus marchantiophytorum TaxID=1619310 RepID=A0ABQ1F999_9BACL|nr:hypothetical protein GCM10008018_55840 [Paenibacillus marchantiophytorum]
MFGVKGGSACAIDFVVDYDAADCVVVGNAAHSEYAYGGFDDAADVGCDEHDVVADAAYGDIVDGSQGDVQDGKYDDASDDRHDGVQDDRRDDASDDRHDDV